MAVFRGTFLGLVVVTLVVSATLSAAHLEGFNFGSVGSQGLFPEFYQSSCPQCCVNDIVISMLQRAIEKVPRVAASLIRLHFHDCFALGCDASVLLDNSTIIRSEKGAKPNVNSLRGFEVIDEIKAKVEEACPLTVSCADIVALAARGSTVLSGGPDWVLPLGRRDSITASAEASDSDIPAPIPLLSALITAFERQGLDETDLVALSGAHTMGFAKCRLARKSVCPGGGGDNTTAPLDVVSPTRFDNSYFKLIVGGHGLLPSDQVLLTGKGRQAAELVNTYAANESLFFQQFAKSMVKMGNINPLTGSKGQVRKDCRHLN
ncbi:peroxidase 9-like [Pyrus x bretschneideri]|uniref:peroxidase 9-like n=1 Tax=Pyrus x bretschneideri TaxID=225117 RepID=UPI00202F14DA|nr:peroxidase 9-like [Pyrus x bretschneideri]